MQLKVLSAPRPHPATALEKLTQSAFTPSDQLAFLTVVLQSDSKILNRPEIRSVKGARSRRRASNRIQAQKSAVKESLSWMLNRLAWVESTGLCGPWVCTVESSSLDRSYGLKHNHEHRQQDPDIFHMHALISLPIYQPTRHPIRDQLLNLESHFSIFGNAQCIVSGSSNQSLAHIADYISKYDPMADALASELFRTANNEPAPSRFFASTSLQDRTPTPWLQVATKPFPYRHPPRTSAVSLSVNERPVAITQPAS